MLRVTPIAEVDFARHVDSFDVAPTGYAVAASKDGRGTVLGPRLETTATFRFPHPPRSVAISPRGDRIAYVAEERLRMLDGAGNPIALRFDGRFKYLSFSYDGSSLWCGHAADDTAIDVFDAASGERILTTEIEDPIGDSAILFFPHPNGMTMGLWLAAGQDGQCIRWARIENGTLAIEELEDVWDTTPPTYDRDGERYLTVSDNALRLYSFADDVLLGTLPWPFDDDDQFAEHHAFIGDDRAVVKTNNERIYVVDVTSMTLVDEMVVDGHDLRPVSELYPSLADDSLSSDLDYFLAVGGTSVVSLHSQLPSADIGRGKTRAALWRLS